jgi:uncharacterized membrane protein YgdD (TMEM256/DUF423 family)
VHVLSKALSTSAQETYETALEALFSVNEALLILKVNVSISDSAANKLSLTLSATFFLFSLLHLS